MLAADEQKHYETIQSMKSGSFGAMAGSTALDEARNVLYYFKETIFDALTNIYEELEDHIRKHYEVEAVEVPNFLRFGSWVGGDRDGNPFVTHEVTYEILRMQKNVALERYVEEIKHIQRQLSSSAKIVPISLELVDSIERDRNQFLRKVKLKSIKFYRAKLENVHRKLLNTISANEGKITAGCYYLNKEELLIDLYLIDKSLRETEESV
jgi:phosphoenolpyruvate carboxylase